MIEESRFTLRLRCPCGNRWSSETADHQSYKEAHDAAVRDGWVFSFGELLRADCPACAEDAP